MARPKRPRRVAGGPDVTYFKPRGVPMSALSEVLLELDEYESLRLADLEGMYQQDAAVVMGVSRQTFARMLGAARRKVADALVHGRALRIEGLDPTRLPGYRCPECRQVWIHTAAKGRPGCPTCGAEEVSVASSGELDEARES
jgi:predicted DNA-binding protein (UPF0251 family)